MKIIKEMTNYQSVLLIASLLGIFVAGWEMEYKSVEQKVTVQIQVSSSKASIKVFI